MLITKYVTALSFLISTENRKENPIVNITPTINASTLFQNK